MREQNLLEVSERPDLLDDLIKSHDIVVSLLPWTLHFAIAEHAIANKTKTTSYLSPGLQGLHEAAVDAGVTVVNECGVDPGIDHFLAMECFDDVHQGGVCREYSGPGTTWATQPKSRASLA